MKCVPMTGGNTDHFNLRLHSAERQVVMLITLLTKNDEDGRYFSVLYFIYPPIPRCQSRTIYEAYSFCANVRLNMHKLDGNLFV